MSRARKSTGPKSTVTVEVTLRRKELSALRRDAATRGMRIGEYLRQAGLSMVATEREKEIQERLELARPSESSWPRRFVVHS